MEKLRRLHNDAKKDLIVRNVHKGQLVLDVGCGRGGDLHKYKGTGCILMGIDPDAESVQEANKRAQECDYTSWSKFYVGDITNVNDGQFDVVCFNFSLQYTFIDEKTLDATVEALTKLVKRGGKFIGVVPDASRILRLPEQWSDRMGNSVERGPSIKYSPKIGNMILVKLADGPYYAKGAIPEPLCYMDILIDKLKNAFELEEWSSMIKTPQGTISDIYSRFIFRRM